MMMTVMQQPWGRRVLGAALIVAGACLLYMGATTGAQWALAVTGAFARPSPAAASLLRNLGLLDVLVGTTLLCAGQWLLRGVANQATGPQAQAQAR